MWALVGLRTCRRAIDPAPLAAARSEFARFANQGYNSQVLRKKIKSAGYGDIMREITDSQSKGTENEIPGGRAASRPGRLLITLMVVLLLLPVLAACGKDGETEESGDSGEVATLPAAEERRATPSPISVIDATATVAPTATPTVGPPPAPLAAMVNGRYIFLEDYEHLLALYEQAIQEQGIDLDSEEGQAELALVRIDALEALIDSELMREEGEALGLTLSEEEIEAQVEIDIDDGGGQQAFDEWLAATGQTRADYTEMLRDLLLSERILELVAADLPMVADQVHIRHIAVSSEAEAQEILAQIQQGADFTELARSWSVDTMTKDEGGDLGWIPAGIVDPELERAAFALQVGETSGAIQLGDGYHVIQVVGREADRPVSPDLQIDLEMAAFEQWLKDLRAAAVIERFVGE